MGLGANLKKIFALFGIGLLLDVGISVYLSSFNVKDQIKNYYSSIQNNLVMTKDAIEDGRYYDAMELSNKNKRYYSEFDMQCGQFQFLFEKGRVINKMAEENNRLNHLLENAIELEEIKKEF